MGSRRVGLWKRPQPQGGQERQGGLRGWDAGLGDGQTCRRAQVSGLSIGHRTAWLCGSCAGYKDKTGS